VGKAGKTHQDKTVSPNHGVAATTRRPRPTIISGRLTNFLEIQTDSKYHEGNCCWGPSRPRLFGAAECGNTLRPGLFHKNSPCLQGLFNPKFPTNLSIHSEI
jgi:hypothetical protein